MLQLEQEFKVKIKTQAIDTVGITYGALTEKLRFGGVEVLMIDAEGHDLPNPSLHDRSLLEAR